MRSIAREIKILIDYARSAERTAQRTKWAHVREHATGKAEAYRLAAARLSVLKRQLEVMR